MRACHTVRPVFDDPNLVSAAGLVPLLRLAESAGSYDLLEGLTVASPNAGAKTLSVVAGMLAGADSIDDLDLLRHGGMAKVFTGVRAPSTLGSFLRSFTHGHVQQLDAVSAGLLTGLAGRVPGLLGDGNGGGGEPITFVDVDDTIREVHGYGKQAAGFGYSGARGLNVQLATVSTQTSAPVIARARLRRGNVASHTGAGRLLAQALNTARAAGVTGPVLARADSAYYGHAFAATARRHGAWFSVTARMNPSLRAAIAGIAEDAWTAIAYPNAVYDEAEGRWVSDAELAEVPYVAFTGRRKAEHIACRLIVRRVRRLQPLAHDGSAQGELFATWRHHAFITDSALPTIEADQIHRDHAIVEQVIAELKDGPLAHLPSGRYTANAAWLSCAVIAFNLARAAAVAAGFDRARWTTMRRRVINVPARIASSGRRHCLHLPAQWAWATAWHTLWRLVTGPPATTTT
ncbi:IS1380 family transposase [bacterium]|nr:MAG: IS1380 family transposase [bacterium]